VLNQVEPLPFLSLSAQAVEGSLHVEGSNHHVVRLRSELTDLLLLEKRYFLRIAASILRDEADAEDTVHSAYCAAWKAVPGYRAEATMKTWFSRIVANHAIVALKKLRRNKLLFLEDNPEYLRAFELNSSSAVEDPEKIALRRESLRLVSEQMQYLPAETRTVVRLYFSGDCSIEKIAELRGKSRPSITAHLHRGKALLRKRVHRAQVRKDRAARVM